jgi:hypothetical protein
VVGAPLLVVLAHRKHLRPGLVESSDIGIDECVAGAGLEGNRDVTVVRLEL